MEMTPAANAAADIPAAVEPATPSNPPDNTPETNPTNPPPAPAQPDVTQTQTFARRLKEATEKARQDAITETEAKYKPKLDTFARYAYGEQGVRSYEDIASQVDDYEYQQQYGQGVSRQAVEKAVADAVAKHPDVLAAGAFNRAQVIERDAASLAKNAAELGITDGKSLCEYLDANQDVADLVDAGWSPERAIWAVKGQEIASKRADKVRQDAQQDTIAKLQANAVATPGAVGQGGANESEITFTDAQFNNPDQKRLVRDTRYYNAYMSELRRRTKG